MPLDLVRTTDPADAPVSRVEAKAHLRVTTSSEDTLIDAYVAAATAHLDGYAGILGRALVEQTWTLHLPAFPCSRIVQLPLPPLIGVDAITYLDADGQGQTLSAAAYHVLDGSAAQIRLKDGEAWPTTIACHPRAVSIEFTCGYGEPANVPEPLKAAIKLMVGDMFANRESAAIDNSAVDRLCAPYRVWGL